MADLEVGDELRTVVVLEKKWKTHAGTNTLEQYWQPHWGLTLDWQARVHIKRVSNNRVVWYDIKVGPYMLNGMMEYGRIVCASHSVIAIFEAIEEVTS